MRRPRWRRQGSSPPQLGPKDALGLISANGVAIGRGALLVAHAETDLRLADLAAAVSIEAYGANPQLADELIARAKPVPGQIETAAQLRRLLQGSALHDPDAGVSLQDPISFRVVPQVHGAVRELIGLTRSAVETELNARNDNPLVIDDRMISSANFHPMLLALCFDALRPGLAHIGVISERRMSHLWERFMGGIGAFSPEVMFDLAGGPSLWWPAAATMAELGSLASSCIPRRPPTRPEPRGSCNRRPGDGGRDGAGSWTSRGCPRCRVALRSRLARGTTRPGGAVRPPRRRCSGLDAGDGTDPRRGAHPEVIGRLSRRGQCRHRHHALPRRPPSPNKTRRRGGPNLAIFLRY